MPEIDAPGHAYAFGLAFPEMVIPCTNVAVDSDIGPVNIVPVVSTSISYLSHLLSFPFFRTFKRMA